MSHFGVTRVTLRKGGRMAAAIGGGTKKILYTLQTARRIGLVRAAKALTSNNACKACGLGMGGQRGGMTNELGEFPSVCNKSVQAQSTDIQPAIPAAVFEHELEDFAALSGHELEHLGRLGTPLHRPAGATRFTTLDWTEATLLLASRLGATDPSRSFFYASGRSSNEAGFLLQLVARAWGTNNVNNCSYYCHQATTVGLDSSIGTGTATIELADLAGADCIFVIGANPASNHPRFIHQLAACRERGGDVIVINPARESGLVKFAIPSSLQSMVSGGTEIASHYLQPNIGADVAVMKALAKSVLEFGAADAAFIDAWTTGWDAFRADLESTPWPELENRTGLTRAEMETVGRAYARSRNCVFAWGMGLTHHVFGTQNVEYVANLALMRGMLGRPHAGLLPLRGHSNVQGIGTIGVKPVLSQDVDTKLRQTLGITLPRKAGLDTMACLEAAHRGEIDAALLLGGNLFAATPSSTWAAEALGRIRFKAYLTTTLNSGHIQPADSGEVLILPVRARDEEVQSTTQESMFNYVRLSDGGIDRITWLRSEVDILAELGERLLPESPLRFREFGDHERIRETIARIIPGMEDLRDIGVARREFHVRGRLLHRPDFKTPDALAHFVVHALPDSQPHRSEFPLTLATVRSEGQFNSIVYEETDSYRNDAPRRALLMCWEDMLHLGLTENERVDVESPHGILTDVAVRQIGIARGNCLAYYPEANCLTSTARDPRSKTPAFKNVPIRVIRRR